MDSDGPIDSDPQIDSIVESLSEWFTRTPTGAELADARSRHPEFDGDDEQLVLLLRVLDTQMRTATRHVALFLWSEHNTERIDWAVAADGHYVKTSYREEYRGIDLRGLRMSSQIVGPLDLRGAKLQGATFEGVSFTKAKFRQADLSGASFDSCCLRGVDLEGANIRGAAFRNCVMGYTNLREAEGDETTSFDGSDLQGADLTRARLAGASFEGAGLQVAQIIETDLRGARLSNCQVFGAAVWDAKTDERTEQHDVLVTPHEPVVPINDRGRWVNATKEIDLRDTMPIRTDSLEHAHLLHLMLDPDLSDFLESMTAAGVLLLGTFRGAGGERLDALRRALREVGLVGVKFDFRRPRDRTLKETVLTLAGLCRFVIADLSDARSIPLELMAIVKDYKVPIVPIQQEATSTFSLFESIEQEYRDRVLDTLLFKGTEDLLAALRTEIVQCALERAELLDRDKARTSTTRSTLAYRAT